MLPGLVRRGPGRQKNTLLCWETLRAQAVNVPAQVGSCLPLSPEEAAQLYTLLYRLLDAAEA